MTQLPKELSGFVFICFQWKHSISDSAVYLTLKFLQCIFLFCCVPWSWEISMRWQVCYFYAHMITFVTNLTRIAMNSSDNSSGAYSLLSDEQGAKILNASDEVKLCPNLELFSNSYRTTTYGISKLNEWHSSSICSNAYGGSDYKQCYRGHLLQTSAYKYTIFLIHLRWAKTFKCIK